MPSNGMVSRFSQKKQGKKYNEDVQRKNKTTFNTFPCSLVRDLLGKNKKHLH